MSKSDSDTSQALRGGDVQLFGRIVSSRTCGDSHAGSRAAFGQGKVLAEVRPGGGTCVLVQPRVRPGLESTPRAGHVDRSDRTGTEPPSQYRSNKNTKLPSSREWDNAKVESTAWLAPDGSSSTSRSSFFWNWHGDQYRCDTLVFPSSGCHGVFLRPTTSVPQKSQGCGHETCCHQNVEFRKVLSGSHVADWHDRCDLNDHCWTQRGLRSSTQSGSSCRSHKTDPLFFSDHFPEVSRGHRHSFHVSF